MLIALTELNQHLPDMSHAVSETLLKKAKVECLNKKKLKTTVSNKSAFENCILCFVCYLCLILNKYKYINKV